MTEAREKLVAGIAAEFRASADQLGFEGLDPRVAAALAAVPREQFVPEADRALAYRDHALPIGLGQTISQPFVVAVMSQALALGDGDRVFELGTGSGYQAAVLAALGAEVYSVEIVPELAERAARTLAALGFDRVHVRAGDGWLGWPEAAPFHAIIVTAATPRLPQRLIDQLGPGGRLILPLGETDHVQQLELLVRQENGQLQRWRLLPVRFVPVTGPMED